MSTIVEFDTQKRIAIIREIDGILANMYPYVLEWDTPFSDWPTGTSSDSPPDI